MSSRPPITTERQRDVVLLAARLGGCTCSPLITFRELSPGVNYVEVAHYSWCAHPSQQKGREA